MGTLRGLACSGCGKTFGAFAVASCDECWAAFEPVYDGLALVPALVGGLVVGVVVEIVTRFLTGGHYRTQPMSA